MSDNLIISEHKNRLFDLYSSLLTEYQRDIYSSYYQDNLSLNEIAENKNVSRNAVFLLIKRVDKILEDYESKLHLLDKYNKVDKLLKDNKEISEKVFKILDK